MNRLILIGVAFLSMKVIAFPAPSRQQAEDFWRLYHDCLKYHVKEYCPVSSRLPAVFSVEPFKKLQGFGPEILELLYLASVSNRLDQEVANELRVPVEYVTNEKKIVLGRLWSINTLEYTTRFTDVDMVWAEEVIESKWKAGDKVANARAEFLLKEMRSARIENRDWDERRAKGNLQLMGIFAFPTLFDELFRGNDDVIEVLSAEEWRVANKPKLTKDGLMKWWTENKLKYELPKQAVDYSDGIGLNKWRRMGK